MEDQGESMVVISDDTAMSVDDSEEDGSESDGFSRIDSNSSQRGSTHSQGTRKRPADDSPERDWEEPQRR